MPDSTRLRTIGWRRGEENLPHGVENLQRQEAAGAQVGAQGEELGGVPIKGWRTTSTTTPYRVKSTREDYDASALDDADLEKDTLGSDDDDDDGLGRGSVR